MIARFKPGKKKCKNCGALFDKKIHQPLQSVCGVKCAVAHAKKLSAINDSKKERIELNIIKESIKTPADYKNELQKVFNQYIKLRDKDQPCISCGTTKKNINYDAGHYYSVGNYPGVRFDQDNVHKQCSFNCNRSRHGNLIEYGNKLPARIGIERFFALQDRRNQVLKLSVPEIKELIQKYKQLIKQLKQNKY